MKNFHLFLLLFVLLFSSGCKESFNPYTNMPPEIITAEPVNVLTNDLRWSKSPFNAKLSSGTLQGAAITGGKIYQFRNWHDEEGKKQTIDIYDTQTGIWSKCPYTITCIPESHAGSAAFWPEVIPQYEKDGTTYTCTIPFVYLSGHYEVEIDENIAKYEVIDIVDIENDQLIRRLTFLDRQDDVIAAYDFANNRMWLLGYPLSVTGMSPYVIQQFNIDLHPFSQDKTNFIARDIVSGTIIGGPNSDEIQESLVCGTLQDADYQNGYIYIAVGRGSEWNRTEWTRIHAYNVTTKLKRSSCDRQVI